MNKQKRSEFASGLDWTKPDLQLARETGVNRSTIYLLRKELGKPAVNTLAIRHLKLLRRARHWKWSAGVAAVAKKASISRQTAYQLRSELKGMQ